MEQGFNRLLKEREENPNSKSLDKKSNLTKVRNDD
jgi:hypothetical protein